FITVEFHQAIFQFMLFVEMQSEHKVVRVLALVCHARFHPLFHLPSLPLLSKTRQPAWPGLAKLRVEPYGSESDGYRRDRKERAARVIGLCSGARKGPKQDNLWLSYEPCRARLALW